MITITQIDTKPQLDPYHRDTGQATWTALIIDPADKTACIRQEYDDNATPEDMWHGRRLRCRLDRPDEDAAREYLTDPDGQALLERVVTGHTVEWDGNNHVGRLTDDADAALDEIATELNSLPESLWSLWTVGDYLADVDYFTAQATDVDLQQIAASIEATAHDDHIILAGDVLDYITEIRDRLQAAWLNDNYITPDEIAEMTGTAASGWRNKAAAGAFPGAVKKGKQWLIPRSEVKHG